MNFDYIAQDSPHARVHRRGTYSRVVGFLIHVADAAIGLRRASRTKEMWTKHCVLYCCRARKKRYLVHGGYFSKMFVRTDTARVLLDGGAAKIVLGHSMRKNNPTTRNQFFQRQRRGAERSRKLLSLCYNVTL